MVQADPVKDLDGTWPAWLQENLERRCNPEQLLEILLRNGFSVASIRAHMGGSFPGASPLLGEPDRPAIDYQALARVRLTRPDSGLNVQQLVSDRLQLYTLDGFLSAEECAHVARIAGAGLRPSTVTTGQRRAGLRTRRTAEPGVTPR